MKYNRQIILGKLLNNAFVQLQNLLLFGAIYVCVCVCVCIYIYIYELMVNLEIA